MVKIFTENDITLSIRLKIQKFDKIIQPHFGRRKHHRQANYFPIVFLRALMSEKPTKESILDKFPKLKNNIINLNDYIFIENLENETVLKYQNKFTGWFIAVKEIIFDDLDDDRFTHFLYEVYYISKISNIFLAEFAGFTTSRPFSLATYYVGYGTLWDAIYKKRGSLSATQKTLIALGIAYGMKYLHSRRILHCNLNSHNILLDNKVLPKIVDYGLTRLMIFTGYPYGITRKQGSVKWMAPELFQMKPYDFSTDIYSYGMILYELYTEDEPFFELSDSEIINKVVKNERPPLPDNKSEISNLIQRCWDADPKMRPSFSDICQLFSLNQISFINTNRECVKLLNNMIENYNKNQDEELQLCVDNVNTIMLLKNISYYPWQIQSSINYFAANGSIYELEMCALGVPCIDYNAFDNKGISPIHAAIQNNQLAVVRFLSKLNTININLIDCDGNSPFLLSVKYNKPEITEYLSQLNDVQVNLQNYEGETALHLLMKLDKESIKTMLLALSFASDLNPNIKDNHGKEAFLCYPNLKKYFLKQQKRRKKSL